MSFFLHLFGNFSSLSFNEKTCVAISNCCCWHESLEKGQQQLFGWSYEFEVGHFFYANNACLIPVSDPEPDVFGLGVSGVGLCY